MHDYLERLREHLSANDLVEVFAAIEELNTSPFCEHWTELITAFGVTGMLTLCHGLGGKTVRIPPLYEVLMVYAALMVIQLEKTGHSFSDAKEMVIGGIYLEGFEQLVDRLRLATERSASE